MLLHDCNVSFNSAARASEALWYWYRWKSWIFRVDVSMVRADRQVDRDGNGEMNHMEQLGHG